MVDVAVTTPDFDFKAEKMMVNLRELTPKQICFQMLTPSDVVATLHVPTPPPIEPVDCESTVRIHMTGIHCDLRDVSWYYAQKTGMMQGESGTYV